MNLLGGLKIALRALTGNKMRTALTMLGMMIGVAVVIVVVAIGEGATKRVTDTVNSLGTNFLSVSTNRNRLRVGTAISRTSISVSGAITASNTVAPNRLTVEDGRVIANRFSHTIEAVAPQIDSGVQVRMEGVDANTELIGTTPAYLLVKNAAIETGRFFTQEETDGSLKVCVVGKTIAEHLTGDSETNLTGRTLAINRQQFIVIGMLAPKGATSWGEDQDDVVLVPVTTAMRRVLNRNFLNELLIRCTSQDMMLLATEQISAFLRNRHHLAPPFPENDDFRVRSQTDLMQTQQSVTGTMTSLLKSVAFLSLVVGGIGIMNIMLVSVTERTREIGIRKAIGATPRDILMQFIIESAIISLLGGLIGIVLGVGLSQLLTQLAGWSTVVNPAAIFYSMAVSVCIGLFFGIYPASKAASLHPIEALRQE